MGEDTCPRGNKGCTTRGVRLAQWVCQDCGTVLLSCGLLFKLIPDSLWLGGTGVSASFAAVVAVSRIRWILERRVWLCAAARSRGFTPVPHQGLRVPLFNIYFRFRLRRSPHWGHTPSKCPVRANRPLTRFSFPRVFCALLQDFYQSRRILIRIQSTRCIDHG